ncbi:hypothetical protein DLAC_08452 [Tieghemostelium lacteum]|uniref:PB1 domain-containing protein n=1 Tax=Tieghemostelium lacteum TaxID=361077 RepID=A0A151ZC78_TIELA|nr:hypothetical protein DLAC_08452 [Tieghemostelium lacteum]|eukprot:KYQ91484.1 hypothetical protein DLAC_08452 [Tieghemostelium lacteum]
MNILIKSELGEDKRRFRLKECSFSCLCYNLTSLYQLSNDSIYSILYLDNENEWITLASTDDLKEAYSISPLLIKIKINLINLISSQKQQQEQEQQEQQEPINSYVNYNRNNTKTIHIVNEILSDEQSTRAINNILSSTLMNYLPIIIKNTIPYTIPVLVSTIHQYHNNNNNEQKKDDKFSCDEEQLKITKESRLSLPTTKNSFILNKSSSMIPKPVVEGKNNETMELSSSSPNLSFKKLSPSSSFFEPLDLSNSNPNLQSLNILNQSSLPILSSKRQSPINFFFKNNTPIQSSINTNENNDNIFRPITPPPLQSNNNNNSQTNNINDSNGSESPLKKKSTSSFRFPFFTNILSKSTKDVKSQEDNNLSSSISTPIITSISSSPISNSETSKINTTTITPIDSIFSNNNTNEQIEILN